MTATDSEGFATGAGRGFEPDRRARALMEALPYIRRFAGEVVVIKYGGSAMVDSALAASFARDVVLVRSVGLQPVVVHGGGPQIGEMLDRLGHQSEFRDGLRVTDANTLDVVRMVLAGRIGGDIVGAINSAGGTAASLTGLDGALITATLRNPELGFVGDVAHVNPRIIRCLLNAEMIPVVAPLAADAQGQAYNINADTVAAALAGALGAAKVVYLTDVAGLMTDPSDPASVVAGATVDELNEMISTGVITGGMIPKAQACIDAVNQGAGSAHMLDGRVPHALLLELFTDSGIGTMITLSGAPDTAGETTQGTAAVNDSTVGDTTEVQQ